jgi:hypothetical protein
MTGKSTSPRARAALTGCLLSLIQLWPGYLNGPLEPLDRFGVPPLLPDVPLQIFACILAFLVGYGYQSVPDPRESDLFLLCAALRSLMIGIVVAAFFFEFFYFLSRMPMISNVSLSHSFRPWTRIIPVALGASVLPTWWAFFNFAGNGWVAKRSRRSNPA